ncbi:MAG: ISLre2 family transposase [Bacilli bacterium]
MKTKEIFKKLFDSEINFKELEKSMWTFLLNSFQHYMVEILEEFDEILKENRDRSRYQIKEKNPRTIQTMVGEVSFTRRYYWDRKKQEYVYLLDRKLDLERHKTIGPGLLDLAVTWATKGPSYRDARDRLTDLFGFQILSHESIRSALLDVAKYVEREQENEIIKKDGTKKANALFIEVDGFYAKLQKNKKAGRKNRGKEAKMAIIHEGWQPRHNGKKPDYKLLNPIRLGSLKDSEEFWEYVRGVISTKYSDIDETLIIINGDGAEWIRKGVEHFGNSIYQYDRFHVARELRRALRFDEKALKKAQKALRKNNIGKIAIAATEALVNCEEVKQKEKLEAFIKLLVSDQEYIIDYRNRLKEQGYKVPAEWRGLGAAESNVNKYKGRTGKRGRSWSLEGLGAILTNLNSLFDGTLQHNVSRVLNEKEEWILDKVTGGVGFVTVKATPSKFTGAKPGSFPATQRGTQGYSKLFNAIHAVDSI